jgi:hypothetical protein
MGDSPEPAHGILLRVELVRARMRTWRANADDAAYVDLDDPNIYHTADRRYLDPAIPKSRPTSSGSVSMQHRPTPLASLTTSTS